MSKNKTPLTGSKITKDIWIYWRWPNNPPTYSKSYIQDVIETKDGFLLEISDNQFWTNYPTRVLLKDIIVLTKK